MALLLGMMTVVVAMRRELLMSVASGVFFGLVMYLCLPLRQRWMPR
jgi:hypothetical protein